MKVYDAQTGAPLDVSEAEAQAGFMSGKYGWPKDAQIGVVTKDGTVGSVDPTKLADIFGAGGRIATTPEYEAAQKQAQYGGIGAQIGGGALEALSKATFGLSDVDLRNVPGYKRFRQRTQQANPTTTAVAGFAGMLVPGVLTGGAGEAAEAAEAGEAAADAAEGAGAVEEGAEAARAAEAAPKPEAPAPSPAAEATVPQPQQAEDVAQAAAGPPAPSPAAARAEAAAQAAAAATSPEQAGLAAQIAKRAAAHALEGTVAGAIQGASQVISDSSIQDHQLTGEQILSTIGANALWAGALGGVFGAAGGALKGLRSDALDKALSEVPTDADIEASVSKATGAPAPEGLAADVRDWNAQAQKTATPGFMAKIAAAASGKDPEQLQKLWQDRAAIESAAEGAAEAHASAAQAIRESGDAILSDTPDVTKEWNGPLKRAHLRRALSDAEAYEVGVSPDTLETPRAGEPIDIDRVMNRDKAGRFKRGKGVRINPNMVESVDIDDSPITISSPRKQVMAVAARRAVDDTLADLLEMHGDEMNYGSKPAIAKTLLYAQEVSGKLDDAIKNGDVAEQYGLVDDLKRAIGTNARSAGQVAGRGAAADYLTLEQNRAVAAKLDSVYHTLRSRLEDESVWGKAAVDQKAVNAAYTDQIEASRRFHRALTTDIGRDPNNPFGRELKGIDPAKVDGYVRNLVNPSQDLTHQAVLDYVDATKRLTKTMGEQLDLTPEQAEQVKRVGKAADTFRATVDKHAQTLSKINLLNSLKNASHGGSSGMYALGLLGETVGHIGGGIAGIALGKAIRLATQPAETIMRLASVERMIRQSDSRIARGLRAFGIGRAQPAASLDVESYARRAAQVQRAMASPETLAERIGVNLGALRVHAPKLADAVTATTLEALRFLSSKLPPEPPGDPFDPKAPAPLPPVAVREQWMRYWRGVNDPLSVVDDLRDGRISPEGIDALRNVYPSLYERTRTLAFGLMAAGKLSNLTKQQRIGLSLALGIDIPEMSPEYIRARQAAYTNPPPGLPQPSAPPPPVKRKPINVTKGAPSLTADRVEGGAAASAG